MTYTDTCTMDELLSLETLRINQLLIIDLS